MGISAVSEAYQLMADVDGEYGSKVSALAALSNPDGVRNHFDILRGLSEFFTEVYRGKRIPNRDAGLACLTLGREAAKELAGAVKKGPEASEEVAACARKMSALAVAFVHQRKAYRTILEACGETGAETE